ncbi:hypothetical protein C5167_040941 [Papaver somniferum]|uniref:Uncharacterized protein n=1 Tax=Papaver somniferum TaxID=3469 RepID=A0A4Y7IGH8_PAPSO|nr:hypothetical protein C5167_040941 [Papaver somniferum]
MHKNTRYTWFGMITYVHGGKEMILLLDSSNKIEVAYQEVLTLKRQEELIRL